MLETWNLVRMYIHIRSFKKRTFSTKALLILLISAFSDMASLSYFYFFDLVLFLLSSLDTDPGFMSILSLILEFRQFSFVRVWQEIRKSEIPSSEFWPTSGDWGDLGIPNLARMSLRKCYWILQNATVTTFTFSELVRENQQGGE